MKLVRLCLVFLLLCALGILGLWAWIPTPSGARAISRRLTARVQSSAPGTGVELQGTRLHWPPALTAERAVWRDPNGRPIALLSGTRAAYGLKGWEVSGRVDRLDLAALDRAVAKGKWKADGFLQGTLRVQGKGGEFRDLDVQLASEPSGGNLNSEALERLVRMMPPGDTRGMLLKAVGAKATFHFNVGKAALTTEGDKIVLNLLLDGDHLLDLKIRVPKESIELLKETQPWK